MFTEMLSPHFSLQELTRTRRKELQQVNREQSDPFIPSLRQLCVGLLEPIRTQFGAAVVIHSGFRCPSLNAAVGGSRTSQHMLGEAADFHVRGVALETAFLWIAESQLPFGQLILEGHGSPAWIHISLGAPWRELGRCREVFTFNGREYSRIA